jgi:hypothetical protein
MDTFTAREKLLFAKEKSKRKTDACEILRKSIIFWKKNALHLLIEAQ